MNHTKENISLQKVVLLMAVILFGVKIAAWFYTGSVAILSDALESIVNIIAGALGLFGLVVAAKPRDLDHPYGHGKAEYLSSAAEGVFILLAGLYIIYQAVRSFFVPHEISELHLGIIMMALTAIANYFIGEVCERRGKKNNSLQLIAAAKHLKTDTLSTGALIAGLILIYLTDINFLDGIIALVAALFIIATGVKVMQDSIGGMMDKADERLLEKVVAVLNEKRNENWIDLHNVRIIKYGDTLHCDCHLTVPWYLNVREAHEEISRLAEVITNEFGTKVEMFVHTDPCLDYSCRICSKRNCHVRKHPLEKKITWTVENIVKDRKHRITDS